MALSKVMPSTSSAPSNSDLSIRSSFIKSLYADAGNRRVSDNGDGSGGSRSAELCRGIADGDGGGSIEEEMTLEDFLTKAGVVIQEDIRVPDTVGLKLDDALVNAASFCQVSVGVQSGHGGFGVETSQLGFANEVVAVGGGNRGGSVGRGKRKAAVEEIPLDKATQQKQRRMIKNRESAARSRERKQAYTVELESLVMQLEEENARLLREKAEQNKRRLEQLMKNLIPVVEKQRPTRVLRRICSMSW